MKVICGLGNPGQEYATTRHNTGFLVVEKMIAELSDKGPLNAVSTFNSQAEVYKQESLLLIKPQTYMNNSGEAVQAVLHFYQVKPSSVGSNPTIGEISYPDLWVIHDDLDLALGSFKIQFGTGPKVHNGLGSLYQHLKTTQFWHVRIGVDSRQGDRSMPGEAYVLQVFSSQERQTIDQVAQKVTQEVLGRVS